MTRTTVDSNVIRSAVTLACRAPSLHNSQPWRWVVDGPVLHLYADSARMGRGTDHSGREVLLSCGAVLHHLRVALAVSGWDTAVDRFPNPNNPEHLATLDLRVMEFITDAHRQLADAILRRHTDRLPFLAPDNWDSFEPVLRSLVDWDHVGFDAIPDGARPQLAQASRLTEELRKYDSSYKAELHWWTTPFEQDQGVPPEAVLSDSEAARVDVGRAFPTLARGARRPGVAADKSKIIALSTHDDARGAVLRCGEVLSAVLLECTVADLATCTLSHLTELPVSRDIIGDLVGRAKSPQLLIRIGRAPALEEIPTTTPRRALDEVLQFRG